MRSANILVIENPWTNLMVSIINNIIGYNKWLKSFHEQ